MFTLKNIGKPRRSLQRRWSAYQTIQNWDRDQYRRAERKLRAIEKLIMKPEGKNIPESEAYLYELDWGEEKLLREGLSYPERVFVWDCLSGRSITGDQRLREILDLLPRRVKTERDERADKNFRR